MGVEVRLTANAEQDLAEAYAWYEDRRIGLGEDFLSRVEAALAAIGRQPEKDRVVFDAFRRALVRRFPFAIYYEFTGDAVIVFGVIHVARDPEKWRHRLR